MTFTQAAEPSSRTTHSSEDTRYSFTEVNRLTFSSTLSPKLTHYAFRYPAKFHIPVVRTLIHRYTNVGDTCLDPFNGSGTLVVEAVANDRAAIGLDVDPVAVFVSRAKSTRLSPRLLQESSKAFAKAVQDRLSKDTALQRSFQNDISKPTYEKRVCDENLSLPPIPHLRHWFRRSVIVQLARINKMGIIQNS